MGNEKSRICYAREYDARNLETTEHRRCYLGFQKWSCFKGHSGVYKIVKPPRFAAAAASASKNIYLLYSDKW